MTLVPNETEQALNRQHDVYAAAREEYRKKIAEQAAEIERLNEYIKRQAMDILLCKRGNDMLHEENTRLRAALRNAYEVYAGSDGFIPETAGEGYQQQIIKQMVDCISAALEEGRT